MKKSAVVFPLLFAALTMASSQAADTATPSAPAAVETKTAPAKKADPHAMPEGAQDLKIGDAAPDFSLPGIDGKTHTLAEYKEPKVLVIAFLSNHCPDSQASEGRVKKLVEDMKGKSFTLVAINPSESKT